MALTIFGPGTLFVTRTDIVGATPINIGKISEFSYDESVEVKQLYGQDNYALAIASGTVKATGKMKPAVLSANAINSAFHGASFTAGQILMAAGEAATIPAVSTYTVTVSNSAHFDTDLGVIYAATGLPLTKVTTAPAQGQYSVLAGVYTFAAADASAAVKISYAYTLSTSGQIQHVVAKPIGVTTTFQIDYSTTDSTGKAYFVRFYNCVATKLTQAFKLSDFKTQEVDFDFFQNAAGKVYDASYGDVS